MSQLKILQQQFQRSILNEDASFVAEIVADEKIIPQRRLAIYQEAYIARLENVLQENYPVLCAELGKQKFSQLCKKYIAKHLSKQASVTFYGNEFSQFLQAKGYEKFYIDLAKLEWAVHEIFYAKQENLMTLEQLQMIAISDWPNLTLQLISACQSLTLQDHALASWQAFQLKNTPICSGKNSSNIQVLIWRKNLDIYVNEIPLLEKKLLTALQQPHTFAELCEIAYADVKENTADYIAELVISWLRLGLLRK
ncbi:MAG: DNA-binding domain-containing protein [Pseudomonadota bacterium]